MATLEAKEYTTLLEIGIFLLYSWTVDIFIYLYVGEI